MKVKKILIWVVAVLVTLVAAIYQKVTGPTYPKKENITIENTAHQIKLIRSHGGTSDASVNLAIDNKHVSASLFYKHFPEVSTESWIENPFEQEFDSEGQTFFSASLPNQPPAGKLIYYVSVKKHETEIWNNKKEPIVIRFKGAVPVWVIIPHVIFIFLAMLWANASGLMAVFSISEYKRNTAITLVLMTIGGMILGPIVQKYAFNEFWAGVPYGWDLTDNKLLVAFLFWLAAYWFNRKSGQSKVLTIVAAVVTLVIFTIPHSMYGSELNRETGEITQGIILFFF